MEEFKNKNEVVVKILQLKVKPNPTPTDKLLIQRLQQKLDEFKN